MRWATVAIREKALGPDPRCRDIALQTWRGSATTRVATPTPSRSTSGRQRSARKRSAATADDEAC
jgi:hypothetical protein